MTLPHRIENIDTTVFKSLTQFGVLYANFHANLSLKFLQTKMVQNIALQI